MSENSICIFRQDNIVVNMNKNKYIDPMTQIVNCELTCRILDGSDNGASGDGGGMQFAPSRTLYV